MKRKLLMTMDLPTAQSPCRVHVSFNKEWCPKAAKEAQDEDDDGTVMILDTG